MNTFSYLKILAATFLLLSAALAQAAPATTVATTAEAIEEPTEEPTEAPSEAPSAAPTDFCSVLDGKKEQCKKILGCAWRNKFNSCVPCSDIRNKEPCKFRTGCDWDPHSKCGPAECSRYNHEGSGKKNRKLLNRTRCRELKACKWVQPDPDEAKWECQNIDN